MKIKAVIAAVVLAALSLTGCSAPSEKGLEYLQEEEYDKAIEEFQKAVDKDDNPGDAYRGIGIAKWEQEDYEGALEAFKSALENGAEKTGTLYNFIGCCALRAGDASSALNYFNLGISQEDNSEELLQEMKFNSTFSASIPFSNVANPSGVICSCPIWKPNDVTPFWSKSNAF